MRTFKEHVNFEQLVESIDATNDTNYASTDLAAIMEQHQNNTWFEPQTAEQVLEELSKYGLKAV